MAPEAAGFLLLSLEGGDARSAAPGGVFWDAHDANTQHCPFPRPEAMPGSSSHWITAINVLINGHSSARAGAAPPGWAGTLQSPPDTHRAADLALICPLKHEIPKGNLQIPTVQDRKGKQGGIFSSCCVAEGFPRSRQSWAPLCWFEMPQVTWEYLKICSSLEYKPGRAHFGNNTFTRAQNWWLPTCLSFPTSPTIT